MPDHDTLTTRRALIGCAVALAVGMTGMLAMLLPDDDAVPPPRMEFPAALVPAAPVSLLPPASPAPTRTVAATSPAAPSRPSSRPAPSRTRSATPAPVVDLVVGRTVGLEVEGQAGVRVRHRDFRARVDRITSGLDRADSRFIVRKGLGDAGCVSLESANYPGYYLRHRNFAIRLDRRGGPERRRGSFARDATFCPWPNRGGTALTLRAAGYPRAVAVGRGGSLWLGEEGTAFVVRSPL